MTRLGHLTRTLSREERLAVIQGADQKAVLRVVPHRIDEAASQLRLFAQTTKSPALATHPYGSRIDVYIVFGGFPVLRALSVVVTEEPPS